MTESEVREKRLYQLNIKNQNEYLILRGKNEEKELEAGLTTS